MRFFIPDSTSAAITGSSGGRPRFSAWPAIHAASCSFGASLPGYASGAAAATAEMSTGAPAGWPASCAGWATAAGFFSIAGRKACESRGSGARSADAATARALTAGRNASDFVGSNAGSTGTTGACTPAAATAGTPAGTAAAGAGAATGTAAGGGGDGA